MLMPQSKMRSMLQRNALTQGWSPDKAKALMEASITALESAIRCLGNVEGARDDESIDPIPDMDRVQRDVADVITGCLMAMSQIGLDPVLFFSMATAAEATGTDAFRNYTGVSQAALLNAWGSDRHAQLGFHPRTGV